MGFDGYALADYHVHPDFSIDAVGTMDEHCKKAVERRLSEICFTTHYDSDPKVSEKVKVIKINGDRVPLTDEAIEIYLNAVRTAQDEYFPLGLMVKAGIEVSYYPGCEEHIGELFAKHNFDYKLVGVHDIDGVCFCYVKEFEKCFGQYSPDQFGDIYFELMKSAVDSDLFDSVAHLDIYRRYGEKYYGEDILKIHKGRIEPVFKSMLKTGVGFEINTAAFRHGLSQCYPSMEIVNLARSMGVSVTAIGSDAHKPDDVGDNLDSAAMISYDIFPYTDE